MARKKKHPEHVNHERWLISYADFITLLFAFFVVMFAVSQVDSKKLGRFTESFQTAVGIDLTQGGRGVLPGESFDPIKTEAGTDVKNPENLPPDLVGLKLALQSDKRPKIPAIKGLQILERRHELVLRLPDGLLFGSGNAKMNANAVTVLRFIAEQVRDRKIDLRVEGHTDDRPIRNSSYPSNWDLSTSRATAVIAELSAAGIAPERLSAAGYGEFHPIAPNDSEEGRAKNRRVDLVAVASVEP